MNANLSRLSLLTIKVQKYIPLALMAYTVIAFVIGMRPPEGGGGTGL